MSDRRRFTSSLPLSMAILLTAAGASTGRASNFDFNQYVGVVDPFFFGSQNVIYNYNSGFTRITPFTFGNYYFYYGLPFGADLGFFHYSYQDGRYVEAIYLNDYPI